jgi:hypothetical protein
VFVPRWAELAELDDLTTSARESLGLARCSALLVSEDLWVLTGLTRAESSAVVRAHWHDRCSPVIASGDEGETSPWIGRAGPKTLSLASQKPALAWPERAESFD